MVKLSRKENDELGQTFLKYLDEKNQKITMSKPELKELYQKFRTSSNLKSSFSSILFHMSRRQKKIRVTNGHVYFLGTKDYSSCLNKQSPRSGSSKASKHRDEVFEYLKNAKARDALLHTRTSIVTVSSYPDNLEKSFGYYTFDVQNSTANNFQIVVHNKSPSKLTLTKCLLLRDSKIMELVDDCGCTLLPNPKFVNLEPDESYTISVFCTLPPGVGSYCSDVFLSFKTTSDETFLVMRYLRCMRSDDITRLIQPIAPFSRVSHNPVKVCPIFTTIPGEKEEIAPHANRLKFERELPSKQVDPRLNAALRNKVLLYENGQMKTTRDPYERTLQQLVNEELDLRNYGDKFSLLLQLEEVQSMRDIHVYDLHGVTLKKNGNGKFLLEVPGLAEKRPSVLRGDQIFFLKLGPDRKQCENKRYSGYVHEVRLKEVLLGMGYPFKAAFMPGMKFDVSFTFNRFPLKLMHRAVSSVGKGRYQLVLFPVGELMPDEDQPKLCLYDRNLEENAQQKKAVHAIYHGKSRFPYVIYGPPGTGKTVTMVEAIKQIVNNKPKSNVLICAPSNSACDLLVQRILGSVDKRLILRMCAMSRPQSDIPDEIKKVSNIEGSEYVYPTKEELMKKRVIATTLITAGRISSACFPSDHFDYVFVDEAGQAVEPEFIIAVENVLSVNGRVVIAGDPHQLGPIIRSQVAVEHGYGKSYLERMMDDHEIYHLTDEGYDSRVITKLVKNYRSHKAIIKVPDDIFYDNELQVCANKMMRESLCEWDGLPKRGFPVVFHGVSGEDMREGNSPSYFNPVEVSLVYKYICEILDIRSNRVKPEEIGVISPYRKQVRKIRQVLNDKKLLGREAIKVGSVEEFQGQERKVMIISTVRSDAHHLVHDKKFHLGFLQNPKRFNVAVTRAKALLVVIGNPHILCRDYYWKRFLDYCRDNQGTKGEFYDETDLNEQNDVGSGSDDEEDVDEQMFSLTRRLKTIGLGKATLQRQVESGISRVQEIVVPQWRNEE